MVKFIEMSSRRTLAVGLLLFLTGFTALAEPVAENSDTIIAVAELPKTSDWMDSWQLQTRDGKEGLMLTGDKRSARVLASVKGEIPTEGRVFLRITYFNHENMKPFTAGICNWGSYNTRPFSPNGQKNTWQTVEAPFWAIDLMANLEGDGKKIRTSVSDINNCDLIISKIEIIKPARERILKEFREYVRKSTAEAFKIADSGKYPKAPYDFKESNFSPSSADKACGAAPFMRNYVQRIYPASSPSKEEKVLETSVRMTSGEYEPCQIGIKALKDFKECSARFIGKLPKGLEGEIRWVESVPLRFGTYNGSKEWQIQPNRLWPAEIFPTCEVKSGDAQAWFVTFNALDDIRSGKYPVSIGIFEGKEKILTFVINVEILPFRLPTVRELDYAWGFYKSTIYDKLEVIDQVEHGVNSASMWPMVLPKKDGRTTFEFWDKYFVMLNSLGMNHSFVLFMGAKRYGYTFGDDFKDGGVIEILKHINQCVSEGKYPKNFCVSIDEAVCNNDRFNDLKRLFSQVRENAPLLKRFGVSLNRHDWAKAHTGIIDVLSCNGSFNENSKWCAQERCKIFTYCTFTGRSMPGAARFNNGFNPWRYGASGTIGWGTDWLYENPYNDLDYSESDQSVYLPNWLGRPIATPAWEAYREGIDDRRYIEVYAGLVKEGKADGKLLDDLKAFLAEEKLSSEDRVGQSIFQATLGDDLKLVLARNRLIDGIIKAKK